MVKHYSGKTHADRHFGVRNGAQPRCIGQNLPALWSSDTPATAVAALLADKVSIIDRKIEDLTALKKALLDRVAQTCPLRPGSRR